MLQQFHELSLAAKLLSVTGPLLFAIALGFSIKDRAFSWPNIAVMVVGLLCPFLPSVQKLSLGKDSISFEQFDTATAISRDALEGLQKAAKVNSDALAALSAKVDELSRVTNLNAPSTGASTTYKNDLTGISAAVQRIENQVKNNDRTLDDVRSKTDALNRLVRPNLRPFP